MRATRKARNRADRAARRAANRIARAERERRADRTEAGSGAAACAAVAHTRGELRTLQDHARADRQSTPVFNILAVAQAGRLEREAALLAASLRRNAPGFRGRLIVAEPQPTGAWQGRDVRLTAAGRAALTDFGAEIVPLHAHAFGHSYPHGNKIEALALLPAGEPFLFLDSDTVITGPIGRLPLGSCPPTASMRREGTWPDPPLYGPGYNAIWSALYDRFGLDLATSLDLSQPEDHWERYLYFNAGWFCGPDPAEFGRRFLTWATDLQRDPGEALAAQALVPWLDQVILPLVIHSLGGGRPGPEFAGMDGAVAWHWRKLPLLYAAAPDSAVEVVEALACLSALQALMAGWPAWDRLVVGGDGRDLIRPRSTGPGCRHANRSSVRS
ncbi:hypothetical protein [uncultured Paracoccus sp.]|uniref:hypothetical protein n=1 Tax=uncultured Paracoccus sp. TaxID=189685 RepID=UPI0034574B7E